MCKSSPGKFTEYRKSPFNSVIHNTATAFDPILNSNPNTNAANLNNTANSNTSSHSTNNSNGRQSHLYTGIPVQVRPPTGAISQNILTSVHQTQNFNAGQHRNNVKADSYPQVENELPMNFNQDQNYSNSNFIHLIFFKRMVLNMTIKFGEGGIYRMMKMLRKVLGILFTGFNL